MGEKKYLVDSEGLARLVVNIKAMLGQKVDIENGKGLSAEDFTTALKTKLENLENYSLPIASAQTLGGVKIGDGLSINASDELELDKATKNGIGGVIVGDNINVSNGTISVPSALL